MKQFRPNQKPTFFWQGFLMLLPVIVLAAVSLATLRQDERRVEEDARRRAAENVQTLAHSVRTIVNDEIQLFRIFQENLFVELGGASMPNVVRTNRNVGVDFPSKTLTRKMQEWEKRFPGLKSGRLRCRKSVSAQMAQCLHPIIQIIPIHQVPRIGS